MNTETTILEQERKVNKRGDFVYITKLEKKRVKIPLADYQAESEKINATIIDLQARKKQIDDDISVEVVEEEVTPIVSEPVMQQREYKTQLEIEGDLPKLKTKQP